MRKFTITIEAKTEGDAESALSWISDAILKGSVMAPWNSDGEGSGYSFSSEGDFDDAFIHGHNDDDDVTDLPPRRSTSNSRRHANRPKAENMLLDRIVAKICKPIIAKTDSISGVLRPDRLPNGKQIHIPATTSSRKPTRS